TLYVNEASVIVYNEPAVNGVLHIINQVLGTTAGVSSGAGDILEVLSDYPYYSRIKEMLINTGVAQILQELDSYTMFIPSNSALMGINLSEPDLKYSIIGGQKLFFEQLNNGLRLETMLGQNYDVIISAINSSM
ncbi:stabilin-2-like, partial [Anneissia japonica]|uniref:stabilin-2-like n=1 Tax=Anneissia japonica TaxID=1529436 RepID=UPI0014259EF8